MFDLFLRGFAPRFVRCLFRARLERYELRDVIDPASEQPVRDLPVMSGCCMLVRRKAIDATGGFDPEVLPLLRGLRLERAPATRSRRRPTCRRFGSCTTAAVRRAKDGSTSAGSCSSGVPFLRQARLAIRSETAARHDDAQGLIVVTGAGGFIGRALVAHFVATGRPFVAVVRRPPAAGRAAHDRACGRAISPTASDAALDGGRARRRGDRASRGPRACARTKPRPIPPAPTCRRTSSRPSALRAAARARGRAAVRAREHGQGERRGERCRAGRSAPADPLDPRDAYARSKPTPSGSSRRSVQELARAPIVLRLPLVYGPRVKGNFLTLLDDVARGAPLPFGAIRNRRSLLYVGNLVRRSWPRSTRRRRRAGVVSSRTAKRCRRPSSHDAIGIGAGRRRRASSTSRCRCSSCGAALSGRGAMIARLAGIARSRRVAARPSASDGRRRSRSTRGSPRRPRGGGCGTRSEPRRSGDCDGLAIIGVLTDSKTRDDRSRFRPARRRAASAAHHPPLHEARRRLGADRGRRHEGAVHRERRGRRAAVPQGQGAGLAHRRIRDAAARDQHARRGARRPTAGSRAARRRSSG